MEEPKPKPSSKTPKVPFNWRLIRKVEGLVFASMLIAVPVFGLRIMDTTYSVLLVNNSSVDLVKNIISAKELAAQQHVEVTVSSTPAAGNDPFGYVVQAGTKTCFQYFLPRGVSLVGSVTFEDSGTPKYPTSFVISKGSRAVSVDVDAKGRTSTTSI
jgi:hypothetical protein